MANCLTNYAHWYGSKVELFSDREKMNIIGEDIVLAQEICLIYLIIKANKKEKITERGLMATEFLYRSKASKATERE